MSYRLVINGNGGYMSNLPSEQVNKRTNDRLTRRSLVAGAKAQGPRGGMKCDCTLDHGFTLVTTRRSGGVDHGALL